MIATSAGGPIGLRLALDHPAQVHALVLLNTGAAIMSGAPAGVPLEGALIQSRLETVTARRAVVETYRRAGLASAIRLGEVEWRTPPEGAPDAGAAIERYRSNRRRALERLSESELRRLALGAILNMSAQLDVDLAAELPGLRAPALVLHGDADTTIPLEYGQALADGLAEAEFVRLDGVGHRLITQPAAQRVAAAWLAARA